MARQVLITGGTGKTGSRVVDRLRKNGFEPRIASRGAKGAGSVRFDWLDPATFDAAVAGVQAAYIVAPSGVAEPLEAMRPFLDHAIGAGVERFVLLSVSLIDESGPLLGPVHAYLKNRAPHWTVLRPTWFMQNFSEQQHVGTIRKESAVYSAAGDGPVPFIDAGDIAAVAAEALTKPDFPDRDLILTGPRPLTYDEAAAIVSKTVGRTIVHRRLSEADLAARFLAAGLPPAYAHGLAAMDTAVAAGAENRTTSEVKDVTGENPVDFATFAAAVHNVWLV